MSTRSRIGIIYDTHTESVYCHNDGYPEYNGQLLRALHNDESSARALVACGDLSCLHRDGGVRSYHNWRNAEIRIERHERPEDAHREEYVYLWDARSDSETRGMWLTTGHYRFDGWRALSDVLEGLRDFAGE